MILSQTPFRISFVGGGTDLPDFYRKKNGCVVSTTINKYVYIGAHPSHNGKIRLQYSQFEEVDKVENVRNTRIRECMKMAGVVNGIEIHSLADVPIRSGLGGSSSFTVGLLNALYAYQGKIVSPERLAREACKIEIDILKEPIGKQDQYIAAYGGFNYINFKEDESVFVNPVSLNPQIKKYIEERVMLFYVFPRGDASVVLAEQKKNISKGDNFKAMEELARLTNFLKSELLNDRVNRFGEILHKGWELKKSFATKITNTLLDEYYQKAIEGGAAGGKICGAGGGGFLLIYSEPEHQEKVRVALSDLKHTPVKLCGEGSKIVHIE